VVTTLAQVTVWADIIPVGLPGGAEENWWPLREAAFCPPFEKKLSMFTLGEAKPR